MREPVTGNKRAVLADLIIIQDYLFGEPMQAHEETQPMPMQSYSAPPMEQVETYIETNGDSEFLIATSFFEPFKQSDIITAEPAIISCIVVDVDDFDSIITEWP